MAVRHIHIPKYTYEEYKTWKGDWELIDGFPYAMSSPSKLHQDFAMSLIYDLESGIRKSSFCKNRCKLYYELDWIINNETTVRPDIALVCNVNSDTFITQVPVLIVEILSKSTAYNDQIIKKELYAEQGVKYYFIASPETSKIDKYILVNEEYVNLEDKTLKLSEECSIDFEL